MKYKHYDVETYNGDIVLDDGKDEILCLEGGALDLENKAINDVGYWRQDTTREEDGETLEYDGEEVRQHVEDHLIEYIESHWDEFKKVEP